MSERHRPLSLAGLRAFAAAARALSFTRAADELHLSQPALSRQIQALEEELGLPLFARGRGLRLTPAGESLRRAVEAGLRPIDECVRQLRGADSRRRIVVSTFASFASLWFIPRLARFGALQPEVDVHCLATDRYVDLAAGEADVALRHGEPGRVGADSIELFPDAVVPVCSPQLAAGDEPPLRAPADLARHTLLMLDEATETAFAQLSFEAWLEARGLPPITPRKVLRFTNHDQVIGAAMAGQGVALGRLPMIAELLAAAQLVMPIGAPMERASGYFLVPAPGIAQRPEIASFIAWVREEARTTRALIAAVGAGADRQTEPKGRPRARRR